MPRLFGLTVGTNVLESDTVVELFELIKIALDTLLLLGKLSRRDAHSRVARSGRTLVPKAGRVETQALGNVIAVYALERLAQTRHNRVHLLRQVVLRV